MILNFVRSCSQSDEVVPQQPAIANNQVEMIIAKKKLLNGSPLQLLAWELLTNLRNKLAAQPFSSKMMLCSACLIAIVLLSMRHSPFREADACQDQLSSTSLDGLAMCTPMPPLIRDAVAGSKRAPFAPFEKDPYDAAECKRTCKLEIVESIPENLTFANAKLPRSTFSAWRLLLTLAEQEVSVAAYKSSLRGKHVLNESSVSTTAGEVIFDLMVNASSQRNVNIRMVENYPPKDPGDNEDGKSLERRGVVNRRAVNFLRLFGTGTMHSKFLVVDQKHFYLGSANLDWRSLNQKMELGVLVQDCPCLAADLQNIFNTYWALTYLQNDATCEEGSGFIPLSNPQVASALSKKPAMSSRQKPLTISYQGVDTSIYLAASPRNLNSADRTWDLDGILNTINSATKFVYIHVMDYIPMMVYREPQKYWPVIDDAVRKAAVERGVEVKMLVAALHFGPKMLYFMKSLQDVNGASEHGSIEIKIFKVPIITQFQTIIARDRRTHNKFMVTEDTVVIGTSNWSGDYFHGSSGLALVANQTGAERPFVNDMRDIFLRDWAADYAHPLDQYMKRCLWNKGGDASFCETEKDEHHHPSTK